MILKKAQVLEICNLLKPGLTRKAVVEQATHFFFTGEEMATFNQKVCITHPFKTDFKASVNSEDFLDIVSRIGADEFNFEVTGNEINMSTGKKNWTIPLVEDTYSNSIKSVHEDLRSATTWKKLPEDFRTGIELCMFSCSKDLNDGMLPFVYVGDNLVCSCDHHRTSLYTMKSSVEKMFIKAVQIPDLIKYPITKYKLTESWMHFSTDQDVVYSTLRQPGEFVKVLEFAKTPIEGGVRIKLPSDLKEIVDSTDVITKEKALLEKYISFTLESKKLTCECAGERGKTTQTTEIKYIGDKLHFQINPTFLSQVLGKTNSMQVSVEQVFASFTFESFFHKFALVTEK
jgi:DNA polymerase III sliding clamp (beta) subunit (PCNA family)